MKSILDQFADDAIDAPEIVTGGKGRGNGGYNRTRSCSRTRTRRCSRTRSRSRCY